MVECGIRIGTVRMDDHPLADDAASDLLEPRPNAISAQPEVRFVPAFVKLLVAKHEDLGPCLGHVVAHRTRFVRLLAERWSD